MKPRASALPEQRAIHHYRTEPRTEVDSEDDGYNMRGPTSTRDYRTATPIPLEPVELVLQDRRKIQQQTRTNQQAPRREPQQPIRRQQLQARPQQAPLQQIPLQLQAREKPRFHVLV